MNPHFPRLFPIACLCWLTSCQHSPQAKAPEDPKETAEASADHPLIDEGLFDAAPEPAADKKTVWNLNGYRRTVITPAPREHPDELMGHPDPALAGATLESPVEFVPEEPMPTAQPPAIGAPTGPREPDAQLAPPETPAAVGSKPGDPLNDIGLYPKQE